MLASKNFCLILLLVFSEYGAAIIDHVLLENGLAGNMKINKEAGKGFHIEQDLEKLVKALKQAEQMLDAAQSEIAKVCEE